MKAGKGFINLIRMIKQNLVIAAVQGAIDTKDKRP